MGKDFILRQWREQNDVRLEDLADLTGMSVATLSRAERGLQRLSPLDKVRIARVVGIRVRQLFPSDAA
jgi:transcriptional regulator with XRE-family HTH domain